jgi:hypothetical protein
MLKRLSLSKGKSCKESLQPQKLILHNSKVVRKSNHYIWRNSVADTRSDSHNYIVEAYKKGMAVDPIRNNSYIRQI